MKSINAKFTKILFCIAVIVALGIGFLLHTNNGLYTVEAAGTTDTFTTGLPDGKKYYYTDITKGITMSGYAQGSADFGSGHSDRIAVTVSNPSGVADGTQTNPYAISTPTDWISFANYVKANSNGAGKYFVLNCDLNYGGAQIPSIVNFNGTFYGLNHVISNVDIKFDSAVNQAYTSALFQTTSGAYISDLIINDYVMNTQKVHSAPLVANANTNTKIANCVTVGEIKANSTIHSNTFDTAGYFTDATNYNIAPALSGIVAHTLGQDVKIYKCSAKVSINVNTSYSTRDYFVGGILGGGDMSKCNGTGIYDCYTSMILNLHVGTSTWYLCTGGIIGHSTYSTRLVQNCISVLNTTLTDGVRSIPTGTIGGGPSITTKNSFSLYNFQIKNRSNNALTSYKLGEGSSETSTAAVNSYAYTSATSAALHGNTKISGLQHKSSINDLWTVAKSTLNPDIWRLDYLQDNTNTSSPIDIYDKPVHLNSAKISFKNADGSPASTGGVNPNEYKLGEDGITDLPTLSDATNKAFDGWTADKSKADSKVYKKYSSEFIGNVDMYPVYKIADFDTDITATTATASNIKNSATVTYTNDPANNVILSANLISGSTLDSVNRTFVWYKDGVELAGKTNSTITLKKVADSGKYKVKVTATASGNVLWRGEAESAEFTVTVNRGDLDLKSDFKIVGNAFLGAQYQDVKFSATAIDKTTNMLVNGTFVWAYATSLTVSYAKDGSGNDETFATNQLLFTPDSAEFDNYLASGTKSFNVQFTPDQFYLIFRVASFNNDELKVPILYNTPYSATQVRNTLNDAVKDYFKLHPQLEAGFSGQAPKLGVPMKNGNVDPDGTVGAVSSYVFIDEYNTNIPSLTKQLTIEVVFDERPITVNFDPMGGVLSNQMDASHNFGYNDILNTYLKKPTYPGNANMRFLYWYYETTDEGGNTVENKWDNDNDRVTQPITLKAKWRQVILTLTDLKVEQNPLNKLTAQDALKAGDLIVTAYYIDDQGANFNETLAFDDYKSGISFVTTGGALGGPKLHVGSIITVTYTYGVPAVTKTTAQIALTVNAIDLKTEEWDIYKDQNGDRKVVARVNDDGSPVNLNVSNMIPNDAVNYVDLGGISYKYVDIGNNPVAPSDVNTRGVYTVTITVPTKSDDYIAHDIVVELELKDVTKVFVNWTNDSPYSYKGGTVPQHPTAVVKDGNGVEILAKDWKYEFLNGDGIKVMKGHSVSVKLLNDAYEFDNNTTTFAVFEIKQALLQAPTVKDRIEYEGATINLADHLDGFNPDLMEIVSGESGLAVDSYSAIVKIKDVAKANCAWSNGATTQTINWNIEKRTLTAIWSKSTFILADVGNGVNPKVTGFVGMFADDLQHFDFDNDLIYSGDLAKTEQGAYKISVKLNNQAFSQNYLLSENTDCQFVIVLSADVKIVTVVWNNIPVTGFVYNGQIQAPSLNDIKVMLGDKDITSELLPLLTLGGDVSTSKWAGSYKATLTLPNDSGYSIISGFETSYKIVKNPQGEGEKPVDNIDNEGNNDGNKGSSVSDFFKNLIEKNFPLWQVLTIAVGALLSLIFMIKAIQYGNRKKQAQGEAKKISSKAYGALLPVFASDVVALGLSNKIWSIIAFAVAGFAVLMLVTMLITRKGWKKAELAKESAIEDKEQRKYEEDRREREAEKQERREFQERITQANSNGADISIIEQMRREMDEQRRADEERHRQEMEAMKLMLANMMGRGQGMDNGEMGYVPMDNTDLLVQKVIAGLLPMVQQMIPEPTAYLSAPSEQSDERYDALMNEMSAMRQQISDMSHTVLDAEIIPDHSEEIRNLDEKHSAQIAEQNAQIADLQSQIADLSQGRLEAEILPDQSEELRAMAEAHNAEMQAMSAEMNAKLAEMQSKMDMMSSMSVDELDDEDFDDEEEWDSILDEDDDDFVEAVIIDDNGNVRKTYPNFRMRLKQSSDKNREWYAVIKNMFCSQKGVTYRVYKRVEKIRYQGQVVGVIGIAKRSIKLWLALKPYEYDARRYHHKDVSDKPRFVDVPMYVRITSDRALLRAEELILALFQELNMEARKRYNDRSIQELIFTLKHNRLLTNKQYKSLLCETMHVHDCDVLDDETAEKCIENKHVDSIDDSYIATLKLDDIDANFQDGNRVTLERLKKVGLVSEDCTGFTVTAGQRLTKPLIIVANDFTLDAVKLITLTGGRAIRLTLV